MTEVGKGTAFTVYLPRAAGLRQMSATIKHAVRQSPRGDLQRVLIVDDEEALVTLAAETLTELGYSPVRFNSSQAAFEAFEADPARFDAIISDERMPGMSGTELIRKIRQIRPTIPILLVSGYPSEAVVRRAREAGANAVLKKPLLARELATSLADAWHAATDELRAPHLDLSPSSTQGAKASRRIREPRARAQPKRRC